MLFMVWEVTFLCGGECSTIGRTVDMKEVMTTHIHKGTRGLSCNYLIAVFQIYYNFLVFVHMVFYIVYT